MAEYFKKDGDEYIEVEDTLFTQDEIDTKIMPKRLERERAKFADYDELKEKANQVDTIKSEYETKLQEKDSSLSTLQTDLKKAQLETDKVKIVHEFKLSDDLAEFVTGDDADTMRKRAEKLAKGFKGGGVPPVNKDGKPSGKGKETDSRRIAKSLFGSKSD